MASARPLARQNPALFFSAGLIVSTAVKLSRLNSRELWLDETYSAYVANLPFSRFFWFTAGDVHPRLFALLLWCWVRIAGETASHLRLFSVLLSVPAGIGMYALGKRLLGDRGGAFAGLLFAFSPTMFVYSLEVRNYMLFVLLLVCLLNVHWILVVEQRRDWRVIGAYGALSAFLVYVHYIGILVLAALMVQWLVFARFERTQTLRAAAAAALTLLLFAPGVPLLVAQHAGKIKLDQRLVQSHYDPQALSAGVAQQGPDRWRSETLAVSQDVAVLGGFYPARSAFLFVLLALPLAAAFAGAIFFWLFHHDAVCGAIGVIGAVLFGSVFAAGFVHHRYYLALVPLLILALARTVQIVAFKTRTAHAGLCLGGLILAIYVAGFYRQAMMPHGHPWANLVAAMQQQARPEDTVIFDAIWAQVPFDYFASADNLHLRETGFPLPIYDWWNEQSYKGWGGPVVQRADLFRVTHSLASRHSGTVWLVSYDESYYDPHDALRATLGEMGQLREIPLSPDPDIRSGGPTLRLFRIANLSLPGTQPTAPQELVRVAQNADGPSRR